MTHNCQTILQPPLMPAVPYTVPKKDSPPVLADHHKARSVLVLDMLTRTPGMSETRIAFWLKVTNPTAAGVIKRMVAENLIERTNAEAFTRKPRRFYQVKQAH